MPGRGMRILTLGCSMASTPPFEPVGPPDRCESGSGRIVKFWFKDRPWTAVYRYTRIELHDHRLMFPAEPYSLEPFIYYPDGGVRHYGGRRFALCPTEAEFVDRTFALLDALALRDRIDLELQVPERIATRRYTVGIGKNHSQSGLVK